jgi:hypothetical protein
MSTKTNSNGQVRKSLAEQIDRLDHILDGLAEGLNEAVATAVQEAVGVAVKEAVSAVITEVLTNPDLLALIRASLAPAAPPAPNPLWSKVRGLCSVVASAAKAAWGKAVGAVKQAVGKVTLVVSDCVDAARTRVVNAYKQARAFVQGVCAFLRASKGVARQLCKPVLVALGVGITVGLGCYLAGPVIASAVSGLAGFAGSLLASALNALRRGLAGLQLHHA